MKKTNKDTGIGDLKPVNQKPPVGLNDYAADIYDARNRQYGNWKYEFGNYLREPAKGITDVERLLENLHAARRHLSKTIQSIIRFLGKGRRAESSLQSACYAADFDGNKPSGLPHIAAARTDISMAIQQAVDAGLLPEDPGTPWLTINKSKEK